MARKRAGSTDRERFLALVTEHGAYTHTREGRTNAHLHGLYRMFAAWIDTGPQRGAHLRGEDGTRSRAFRGDHNWIFLPAIDWDALPAQIVLAKTIAAKRGAGISTGKLDVYRPLGRAIEALAPAARGALDAATKPPATLHAGGPRAKVLGGEQALATALCRACMERVAHLRRETDAPLLERLTSLFDQPRVDYSVLWPAANALPYGTDSAKAAADEAESAAVQTTRAVLGCRYGSQKCIPFVTKAIARTIRELEAESAAATAAFIVELDELIMRYEFFAALAAKTKDNVEAIERVLWRGADAKGFPAWWLVRVAPASYGLLGKLGGRWAWHTDTRDAIVATIPDEHFEIAVEIALARD